MIEIELVALLKADEALNNLVGGRIYPVVAPQKVQKPYITYQVISNNDVSDFGGKVYENRMRFQFDIFSETYSNCKEVLESFKSAIYTYRKHPHSLSAMDGYESDTKLHRQIIDFKLTI